MVSVLSKQEVLDLKQKFDSIDIDRNGSIEVDELKNIMDEDDSNFILSFLDADNNGRITFDEYLTLFVTAKTIKMNETGFAGDSDHSAKSLPANPQSLHQVQSTNIAYEDDDQLASETHRYAHDMIPYILNAMSQHPNDAGVQRQGLYAMRNLAAKEIYREELLDEGAPDLVLHALNMHKDDELLVEEACRAMGLFALDEETAQAFHAESIPLIVEAMKKFQRSPDVLLEAAFSLENLCSDDGISDAIAKSGCIPILMNGMRAHREHAAFQSEACRLLGALAQRTDTRVNILNNGGAELLLQALKEHPDDSGVHQDACHALGSLALTDADTWTRTVRNRDNGLPDKVPVRRVGEPEGAEVEEQPAVQRTMRRRGRRSTKSTLQMGMNISTLRNENSIGGGGGVGSESYNKY